MRTNKGGMPSTLTPPRDPAIMEVWAQRVQERPSSVCTMCCIGHGTSTQKQREYRARGTSLRGVLEGIVPPSSPRSLSAFGPLVVTLVHDKTGDMKQLQLGGRPFRSKTILRCRGPWSPRTLLGFDDCYCCLAFGIAAIRGHCQLSASQFSSIRIDVSCHYLPCKQLTSKVQPQLEKKSKTTQH